MVPSDSIARIPDIMRNFKINIFVPMKIMLNEYDIFIVPV